MRRGVTLYIQGAHTVCACILFTVVLAHLPSPEASALITPEISSTAVPDVGDGGKTESQTSNTTTSLKPWPNAKLNASFCGSPFCGPADGTNSTYISPTKALQDIRQSLTALSNAHNALLSRIVQEEPLWNRIWLKTVHHYPGSYADNVRGATEAVTNATTSTLQSMADKFVKAVESDRYFVEPAADELHTKMNKVVEEQTKAAEQADPSVSPFAFMVALDRFFNKWGNLDAMWTKRFSFLKDTSSGYFKDLTSDQQAENLVGQFQVLIAELKGELDSFRPAWLHVNSQALDFADYLKWVRQMGGGSWKSISDRGAHDLERFSAGMMYAKDKFVSAGKGTYRSGRDVLNHLENEHVSFLKSQAGRGVHGMSNRLSHWVWIAVHEFKTTFLSGDAQIQKPQIWVLCGMFGCLVVYVLIEIGVYSGVSQFVERTVQTLMGETRESPGLQRPSENRIPSRGRALEPVRSRARYNASRVKNASRPTATDPKESSSRRKGGLSGSIYNMQDGQSPKESRVGATTISADAHTIPESIRSLSPIYESEVRHFRKDAASERAEMRSGGAPSRSALPRTARPKTTTEATQNSRRSHIKTSVISPPSTTPGASVFTLGGRKLEYEKRPHVPHGVSVEEIKTGSDAHVATETAAPATTNDIAEEIRRTPRTKPKRRPSGRLESTSGRKEAGGTSAKKHTSASSPARKSRMLSMDNVASIPPVETVEEAERVLSRSGSKSKSTIATRRTRRRSTRIHRDETTDNEA